MITYQFVVFLHCFWKAWELSNYLYKVHKRPKMALWVPHFSHLTFIKGCQTVML